MARFGEAIGDFGLVEPGDRILVGVSGGKDSWALLNLLRLTRRRAPIDFDLVPLNVDQGFPGFRADLIEEHLAREGHAYEMRSARINLTVKEKIQPGETFCSLCARLRRGALYKYADELGCNKIALGHHADDFIETLLLNLFFNGQTKAMPARLRARNGRHTVIRPLVYLWEDEIAEYVRELGRPRRLLRVPGLQRSDPPAAPDEAPPPGARASLSRAQAEPPGRARPGRPRVTADPRRRNGARVGDRLPILSGAAGVALAAALGSADGTEPGD